MRSSTLSAETLIPGGRVIDISLKLTAKASFFISNGSKSNLMSKRDTDISGVNAPSISASHA
ncbi:MAG TPA: hypothetical protein PLX41_09440, partial [Bacteroidales bacterium]|nr:hypothetical protein [Bacteroidales bacterium]